MLPLLLPLRSTLSKGGLLLAAAAAATLALLLALARSKHAGRMEERTDNLQRALEIKDEQLRRANDRPRGRDGVAERMRGHRF